MSTIPSVLREAAERWPDRAAIVDGDLTLSFQELHDCVRGVAGGLGLAKGDRVCLWAPNSAAWEVAALAVTYAGGVLVPLNTRYTGHEVADVVARTRPALVIVENGFRGRSQSDELREAATSELPPVVDLADLPTGDAEPPEVSPDDLADILFTSGTTGRSKGAMTLHRQSVEAARIWGELGEVTAGDRYLLVNPFFHSFGYKAGILVSLLYGATLFPQAVFDVNAALDTIERERITVLPGAPAIFNALLEAPRDGRDLSSLRFAVTGAAMVPVALVERMQSELSFDLVLTAFGMTECVMAAMGRRGDPPALVANTTGRVVPGMELRIDAPEGSPVGTDGELLLRGPLVMKGYLDEPIATAEAIDADGWLHTGDIGRVDADGNLKITDRLKDVYIVGGFNVYPAEVEQTIARVDGVVESAVVGVPDERLGEVGKAFVVRRSEAVTKEDVLAYCKERLANFKVPRFVEFVDTLPRNLSGKILKTELRK